MKRITAFVLAIGLLLTLCAPSANALLLLSLDPQSSGIGTAVKLSEPSSREYTYDDIQKLPSDPSFEADFLPAGPKWLDMASNEAPVTMSVEKCVLADNVIQVGETVTDSIADMGQVLSGSTVQKLAPGRIIEKGGYISKDVLDTAAAQANRQIENDSVVVDLQSGMAFRVVSPTVFTGIYDTNPELSELTKPLENTYAIAQPELHEVVKDLVLPNQTVTLTKGNITGFAPNVEANIKPYLPAQLAVGNEDKTFKYLTDDNLIEFDFKDAKLNGKVGNSTISVTLSGGIAISNIDLTGEYSCMGGYEIAMSIEQECYLVATVDAEVHDEIKVPILGLEVNFGVGKVYGGIFAVIGMDGSFTLSIEAREKTGCEMGVSGGTFLYVPTSFRPIFNQSEPVFSGDCDMRGKINGYIKFGPMAGIELFGVKLAGAGVLLGAGVNVQSDGGMLNIELYASMEIYVDVLGKHINLLRWYPTIYEKQQPDMHGYKVEFLETYVIPGRVGGLIEKEADESGAGDDPAADVEYRVWIVPQSAQGTFDATQRETILSADRNNTQKALSDTVRTYPDSGYARTGSSGEFIQMDEDICYGGDDIWLEFIAPAPDENNALRTFFVGPATPVIPFEKITVTCAEYFNDFITGKVEPQRLIDWDVENFNPDELQYTLEYYEGPIHISPFNDYGAHAPYVICGEAHTNTDAFGVFDTRNPYTDSNGASHPSGAIDVLEDTGSEPWTYFDSKGQEHVATDYPPGRVGILATIIENKEKKDITTWGITPTGPELQISRTLDYVENSYTKDSQGETLVDQMMYDEIILITNPAGTRTVTADMLNFTTTGFSTQDAIGNIIPNPVTTTRQGTPTLTPVLDDDGNPTGTAMLTQRVILQWVWQAHPNPIRITSADHTEAYAGEESSFHVTADGFQPRFSLKGEPYRVWIDEKTGVMYIPQTLTPGTYTFTVSADEGTVLLPYGAPDTKKGHDASPTDEQTFTLTITEKPVGPSPSAETSPSAPPDVSPSASPSPDARTAPVIQADEYNTYFNMDGTSDLTVQFKASGSTPITWALTAVQGGSPPAGISINAATGVMTINRLLADGTYHLAIVASNDVGSDTHECAVAVARRTAPVFENRRDDYQFTMSSADAGFTVQLKANGSAPITYSLEQVNERLSFPNEITIDAGTGLLSVKGGLIGGIAAGFYDFAVRASNDVGSDRRVCRLEVTKASLPSIQPPAVSLKPHLPQLSAPAGGSPDVFLLAASAAPQAVQNLPPVKLETDMFASAPPSSSVTLRCDDPRDVYTHDRETENGASFVHWNDSVFISIIKVNTTPPGMTSQQAYELSGDSGIRDWGSSAAVTDNSPVCDQYHYDDPDFSFHFPLTEEQLAEIEAAFEKSIKDYKNGYMTETQDFSAAGLRDSYFNVVVNPLDVTVSRLEFGTLLDEINGKKSGAFDVALNAETGTNVPGDYFACLMNNKAASITFRQDGVDITFSGSNIQNADALDMFNLGLTYAPHKTAMLETVGAGYESFTYGFQHHGELPGTAAFAVTTDIAVGTKVNVYKYDAATGGFTLIAGNIDVGAGGVVTYKNNTMSEYLITTKTIDGAQISDMARQQDFAPGIPWVLIVIIGLAAAGSAAAVWIFLRRKNRTKKAR